MLSTLEDGKIVRGLDGIPEEGPVLFVGYHMLAGMESAPLVSQFWLERNIVVRNMAHPVAFVRSVKQGKFPPLSEYDNYRMMGAVPVSGTNLYKLLSSKSHVLLYPGGVREAGHRKVISMYLNHLFIWTRLIHNTLKSLYFSGGRVQINLAKAV